MLGVRLEMIFCTSDDTWVSDTELWLLKLDCCCWFELRLLEELLDMALATAVSIWGPRAARTAATSFFCLICSEAAAAWAAEASAATAARRWASASAAAACCCVSVDTEVVVV